LNATSHKSVYIESFSVKDTEIKDVGRLLAKLTHRSLLINPSVRGKISLEIKTPLTGEQLWSIFSLAIAQMGYTLRYHPESNLVEITLISKAKRFAFNSDKKYAGELTVSVIQLKNLDVNYARDKVRFFLSSYGRIETLEPFNILVIYDFANNVKFIKDLLQKLDKPQYAQQVEIFKTENIPVQKFERALRPLLDWYKLQKHFKVYLNSIPNRDILIVSAPKEVIEKIKELKKEIDKPLSEGQKYGFYVIKLKYSSVEEVERAINSLLAKLSGKEKSLIFPAGLKISYDKTNNSILVFGTKKDFETFKKFVQKVDKRKKQVLIVATIVEASAKSILDKGIRWQILGSSGGVAFGATSKEGLYEALSKGQFVVGTLSTSGVSVKVGDSNLFFPDLLFLYSLLEQGSGFNIISNPKILTLDNQKAVIKVGQDVPYPTGVKYDVNGNPIITYDYKYVGLNLDVLPRISEQNLRLIIKLKVQEISGYLTNNVGGINYSVPITSTRELNSDVIVQNGQTVIIGGLISKKHLTGTTKVPVLGNIPLFGELFKYTHKENDKTNLFIFITPYVISSPKELSKIMEEHKKLAMELFKKIEKKEDKKLSQKREGIIKVEQNEKVVLPY